MARFSAVWTAMLACVCVAWVARAETVHFTFNEPAELSMWEAASGELVDLKDSWRIEDGVL